MRFHIKLKNFFKLLSKGSLKTADGENILQTVKIALIEAVNVLYNMYSNHKIFQC